MIIYVVEALTKEAYENTSWIVKAFDSQEKANKWVDNKIKEEDSQSDDTESYCYIITEQELE